jgi:DHHC palmitoyltransferase
VGFVSSFFPLFRGLLATAVVTTRIDPTDHSKRLYLKAVKTSFQDDLGPGAWRYCRICQRLVRKQTKHCRRDNRCCLGFNHHCIWINNCIGHKNYRWFLSMVVLAVFTCALKLVITLIGLCSTFGDPEFLESSFKSVSSIQFFFNLLRFILFSAEQPFWW